MNSKLRSIIIVISILCACILLYITRDNQIIVMDSVNLDESILIGSQMPELLYADEEKVIFHSCGIFTYDIENQVITTSLDVWSFGQNLIPDSEEKFIYPWQFVTKTGDEIIIVYYDEPYSQGMFLNAYSFSTKNMILKEISQDIYNEKRKEIYECISLDYNDERYHNSTGKIASINETDYIYLSLILGEPEHINIVHVIDEINNYYPALSLSKTYELYKSLE